MSTKDKNKMMITTESSPEMVEYQNKWSWLGEKAISLKHRDKIFLSRNELIKEIGRPLTRAIRDWLPVFGIDWDNDMQGYIVNGFELTPTPLVD